MAKRPCLDCGALADAGRCEECRRGRQREKDAARGGRYQRGYTNEWAALARRVVNEERQCRDCAHCGSRDNPLSADHIVPKAHGGSDDRSNLCCRCRRCNSRKGSRPVDARR